MAAVLVLGLAGPALAEGTPDIGLAVGTSSVHVESAAPPLPVIAPPDLPEATVTITVAERVGAAIAARLADPHFVADARLPRHERDGIAAFYGLGAFTPLWVDATGLTPAGRSIAGRLATAADDGLDPRAYPIPALPRDASPAAVAEAELRLAASVSLYARDARGGRIDLARFSRLVTPALALPGADTVLTHLAAAGPGAGVALAAYNPPHPGYRQLKARLAVLRAARPMADAADTRVRVAAAGMPILPAPRLARPGLEADLVVNMERWRWLPADLGARYVAVNIPEFRGRVMDGGRSVLDTRVIVGKETSPTPIFSGVMTYAVVNPSWNVPPSILKNEFLPRLARDPNYAARLGYQVVRHGNTIAVRQPPGERNALGFIKFMFPNNHAVYLHDTPNRSLFSAAHRAFSHGCVRIDDPFRLAETLLGPAWPTDRLKALIGGPERAIHLARSLPVHLTYFTLVAEGGTLRTVPDLYGYDARVKAALGLGS